VTEILGIDQIDSTAVKSRSWREESSSGSRGSSTFFLRRGPAPKTMLDLIGRALSAEDFANPQGVLARGLLWLFSTPWWMPAAIIGVLTLLLVAYLFWLGKDSTSSTRKAGINTPASASSWIQQKFPTSDWEKPLTPVYREAFKNETVQLDGKNFVECSFENVTFLYQGTRSFQMMNCKKIPPDDFLVSVRTDNPVVFTALNLMSATGVSGPIEVDMNVRPRLD
jgi:hypothetical protein